MLETSPKWQKTELLLWIMSKNSSNETPANWQNVSSAGGIENLENGFMHGKRKVDISLLHGKIDLISN